MNNHYRSVFGIAASEKQPLQRSRRNQSQRAIEAVFVQFFAHAVPVYASAVDIAFRF